MFLALSLFILTKNKFYIIYCKCANADLFKINLGPGKGLRIYLPPEKKQREVGERNHVHFVFFHWPHPMALEMWLHLFLSFENDNCVRLTRLVFLYAGEKEKEKNKIMK
jgi:hypothetical protein